LSEEADSADLGLKEYSKTPKINRMAKEIMKIILKLLTFFGI